MNGTLGWLFHESARLCPTAEQPVHVYIPIVSHRFHVSEA